MPVQVSSATDTRAPAAMPRPNGSASGVTELSQPALTIDLTPPLAWWVEVDDVRHATPRDGDPTAPRTGASIETLCGQRLTVTRDRLHLAKECLECDHEWRNLAGYPHRQDCVPCENSN